MPAAQLRHRTVVIVRAVTLLAAGVTTGCAVLAVTDAAVSVAATAVKAGANVVGATVDVARAGIRAVTPDSDNKSP